jgi:hypothetical protein
MKKRKKILALQNKADIARHEYKQEIEKLNLIIDLFDTSYRPILNHAQYYEMTVLHVIN